MEEGRRRPRNLRIPRPLGIAAVALLLVGGTVVYAAGARSDGIFDRAQDGCGGMGCHLGMADADVELQLDGLPSSWVVNTTYELTVAIGGSPRPVLPTHQNEGGFNLEVSAGTLAVPDGSDAVQVGPDEPARQAAHTDAGNDQREWTVEWTAPATVPAGNATVTVWLAVNAVNGNTLNDLLDQWNTATFEVDAAAGQGDDTDGGTGDDGEEVDEVPEGPESIPAASAGAVATALLAAVWWAKRRR